MNYPAELQYSKSHEWIKTEDDVTVIGISDFAQDALGDVVFVNLPGEGDEVTAGEAFGDVESVKAVSDLVSPVSGVVCAVNEELLDAPELLNSDPYGAWIIKVEDVTDQEELLDADGLRGLLRSRRADMGSYVPSTPGGAAGDAGGHRPSRLPRAVPGRAGVACCSGPAAGPARGHERAGGQPHHDRHGRAEHRASPPFSGAPEPMTTTSPRW